MGEYFTLALSQRGYLYSLGSNKHGELGTNLEVPYSVEPIPITSSKNTIAKAVASVRCGLNHALALTKDNNLFAWGSNAHSQIGVESASMRTE